ncbi:UNVERIFIED_ORG: hypothetical protein FHT06_001729 [Xanthomonas campestris]|uniref:competence protein CoiA family protein n=1 Tax=Xanthomonas arboricola TaxID=56448 RepID=UPI0016AE747F
MLIALHNSQRKRAEAAGSGQIGKCPWTDLDVKAHVGAIRQYWAYIGGQPRLPPGYEPESEWHRCWKEVVDDAQCEVVMGQNKEHRADILGSNDTIIEIQRSVIDIRDVRDRTEFYFKQSGKRMIWVVDIQEFWLKRFFLVPTDKQGEFKVDWKPRRTWLWDIAKTPDTHLYLEFNQKNDKLLHCWIHKSEMYCKYITKKQFFMTYLDSVSRTHFRGFPKEALDVLQGLA